MIKCFFFSLGFTFIFCKSPAQFDTVFAKAGIRRCADSLAFGFKTKNWVLFTRYSSPSLIGSLGGKDEFVKNMAETYSPIPVSAWKKMEAGTILQVIKTGRDLQTVVELKSIFEWKDKRITAITYIMGESWDGGLFWTFFDTLGDRSYAKMIKPDLNDQLIIPKKTEKTEAVSPRSKTKNNP